MNQTESIQLVDDSRLALLAVRGALIELYQAVGANPDAPQEVSRQYKINRNLTWKLSRIMNAEDPFSTLNHLPGQQGLELVLEAFRLAGAAPAALENCRAAMQGWQQTVKEHAGDREHLQLTLESMGLFERDADAASGRELAYRGNSMVWGVQARVRSAMTVLAPSQSQPGTLDYAMVNGLVGFRRLRASAEWRLYRAQMHDDKGGPLSESGHMETIDPNPPSDLPYLLPEFCSPNMPKITCFDGPEGREFCLPRGQVGNRASFDCFFGYIYRGLPAIPSDQNQFGSTAATVTLPVESLLFDVIFHRDVRMPGGPELGLYGFPFGGPEDPSAQTPRNLLPLTEKLTELSGSPPMITTPLLPGYSKILERVCARMGWNPQEFRGLRVQLRYPPMSSKLAVRWRLG